MIVTQNEGGKFIIRGVRDYDEKEETLTPVASLPQAQNDQPKGKESASWSSDHARLDARSSALQRPVAEKIRHDASVVDIARRNIIRWHAESGVPVESSAHAEWLGLLDGSIEHLLGVLERDDQHATRLRQSAPFSGILTPAEREAVFAAFAHTRGRAAKRIWPRNI